MEEKGEVPALCRNFEYSTSTCSTTRRDPLGTSSKPSVANDHGLQTVFEPGRRYARTKLHDMLASMHSVLRMETTEDDYEGKLLNWELCSSILRSCSWEPISMNNIKGHMCLVDQDIMSSDEVRQIVVNYSKTKHICQKHADAVGINDSGSKGKSKGLPRHPLLKWRKAARKRHRPIKRKRERKIQLRLGGQGPGDYRTQQ